MNVKRGFSGLADKLPKSEDKLLLKVVAQIILLSEKYNASLGDYILR